MWLKPDRTPYVEHIGERDGAARPSSVTLQIPNGPNPLREGRRDCTGARFCRSGEPTPRVVYEPLPDIPHHRDLLGGEELFEVGPRPTREKHCRSWVALLEAPVVSKLSDRHPDNADMILYCQPKLDISDQVMKRLR